MTDGGWPEVYPRGPEDKQHLLPVIYRCSILGCTWYTAHKDERSAYNEKVRHRANTCPYPEGSAMPAGKSILAKLWESLDEVMDYLIDTPQDKGTEKYSQQQGKAQGLARGIFLMSHPHIENEKDVGKWAGRRKKVRLGKLENFDTPGVDTGTALPASTAATTAPARPAPTTGAVAAPTGLSDERKQLLENGLAAGLPHKSLAKIVKLTEAEVTAYAAQLAASNT